MSTPLATLLYWDACTTSPRVLINKDGSLMSCLRYTGPDLHSAMDSALVVQADRINNLARRLGAGWGLLSEARRWDVCAYPAATWPHPVAAAIDAERCQLFTTPQTHFVTELTLTVTYTPSSATASAQKWKHWFYANLPAEAVEARVFHFADEVQRIALLLKDACEEVTILEDEALLSYLHSTISWKRTTVSLPDPPCYLDTYLPDTDLEHVWVLPHLCKWPKLGDTYLRCVSVKAYPPTTSPGMLDVLGTLPLEHRACERYLPMSREQAVREARKYGDSHYGKRTRHGGSTARVEKLALDYSEQASNFQLGIEHGHWSAGKGTQTVVVWDTDFQRATEKAQLVEQALNVAKFTAKIEGVNTTAAWDGTLPGNLTANTRQVPITSANLSHLLPVTSATRGATWNTHHNGAPLVTVTGRGQTVFGLDPYDQDTGHFLIAGPIGAGKSTLGNLLAAQWLKYLGAQVRIFEIGESFRCLTYAVGGAWYDVGAEMERLFHAEGHLDDADFHPWASAWAPSAARWQCFELGSLMKTPAIVPRVIHAITNALEQQLTGVPTLFLYDEAWKYVRPLPGVETDANAFATRIDDQLRGLRKLNGAVGYLTQSLADLTQSALGPIIQQSCKTRVFLADHTALDPGMATLYEDYGLNPRQRQIIASLAPKRQYYYQGPHGHCVFDLQLGPVTLAFTGSGSKADLAAMADLYAKEPATFGWQWLHHKGLHQEAERLKHHYKEVGDAMAFYRDGAGAAVGLA